MLRLMTKRTLTIAFSSSVVVLGLVITLAVVLISPAITLHNLKVTRFGDAVKVSFETTNHTPHPYLFTTPRLEVREGRTWRMVSDGVYDSAHIDSVDARSGARIVYLSKRLPTGTRLRLRVQTQKWTQGWTSLWPRAKTRLSGGYPVSLSPFDSTWILTRDAEMTSKEFTEP